MLALPAALGGVPAATLTRLGARPNKTRTSSSLRRSRHQPIRALSTAHPAPPLHQQQQLLRHALLHHDETAMLAELKSLLRGGADPNCHISGSGDSPLHLACRRARHGQAAAAVIRLLIEAGAWPDSLNALGEAPLHVLLATEPVSSQAAMAALAALLQGGASPCQLCRGVPPLHAAAAFGDASAWRVIAALAAAGADVRARSAAASGGGTALHAAAANMQVYLASVTPGVLERRSAGADAVAALVAAGADVHSASAAGLQALHAAAAAASLDTNFSSRAAVAVVEALAAAGAGLDAPDAAGLTPLGHAMRNKSAAGRALITALVQLGASPRPLLDQLRK